MDRDEALRVLFANEYRRLLQLVSLLVDDRSGAEDVVQEAFARLYRSWDRIRDVESAPAWLRSTALNVVRSALRRRGISRRLPLVVEPDERSAEWGALLSDDRKEVIEALRALPTRQREVLVLRYWEDASETEIAEWLGISRGSVKSHAHRALTALRDTLEGSR